MTGSFGYELAIDANLANVVFGLYNKSKGFGQTKAGYVRTTSPLLLSRLTGDYLDREYLWFIERRYETVRWISRRYRVPVVWRSREEIPRYRPGHPPRRNVPCVGPLHRQD